MSRNRVRRSFTVETKARGRQAPAFLPVRAPLLEPAAAEQRPAARLFDPAPVRASEQAQARRILPNLIAPPVAEPEPEPVREVEPRLPRVRRIAARSKVEARSEVKPGSVEVAPVRVAPIGAASAPAAQTAPRHPDRPIKRVRGGDESLRLGERWKRRLPRVCW